MMDQNFEAIKINEATKYQDFPVPTKPFKDEEAKREWFNKRETEKTGLSQENGDFTYLLNNGEVDKEFITNIWYGFKLGKGTFFDTDYAKPEDIEIKSINQLLHSVRYGENFEQSASFKTFMSKPEDDANRQKVIDFISDLMMRSINSKSKNEIGNVQGLTEKIHNIVSSQIQTEFFYTRDKDKIQQKDSSEQKEFYEKNDKLAELKKEVETILEKEHIQ